MIAGSCRQILAQFGMHIIILIRNADFHLREEIKEAELVTGVINSDYLKR
jgi:hypothetical protein